ncbi:outer membrane beta-barrel protein [Maribacter chungangensis]|uniref:Outer membrane beta-barrel protein n=1 Tax=Maribacter chungangensis TaxID=1069117 RepID=A0ABW3B128_9FLAO
MAQDRDEKNPLSFSGSIDTYFQTNLTAPDDTPQSFGTAFADQLGFALGMVNVIANYDGPKTGAVADLTFGPRGEAATSGFNVNQLYVYWNVTEKTKLTLGRFNTYLGYEVISPLDNFHYSTSYEFSFGPFTHLGLRADFELSEDFSLMLALMNVTDVNNNLTGAYAGGAQLGYKGQFLNFYYDGGEALGFEIDYTGGFEVSDSFFMGINASYDENNGTGFYGGSIYPELKASDNFKVGLRAEYFAQTSDILATDPNVFATTLTGSYTIENLIIKPEIRLDSWSDNEPYLNRDGAATKSLSSFLIAAIYSF